MTNDFNKTENDSTKTRIDKWQIIDEEFISYTGGTAQLISNGECKVHLWETPKDAQLFCDKLNELNNENKALKKQLETEHTMLDNAILLERTRMGQNSLKQFKESLR